MTQALNLANFANNLNTSGQTSNSGLQNNSVTVTAGTGMSGGGSVALGGSTTLTNAGVTSVAAGTGISVSASTGSVTISASGTGTVTSVATGNGLSGGTITTSGTLTIACPTAGSVGSYAEVIAANIYNGASTVSFGSNYPANYSGNQNAVYNASLIITSAQPSYNSGNTNLGGDGSVYFSSNGGILSGTWKWLGYSNFSGSTGYNTWWGIACRVS